MVVAGSNSKISDSNPLAAVSYLRLDCYGSVS